MARAQQLCVELGEKSGGAAFEIKLNAYDAAVKFYQKMDFRIKLERRTECGVEGDHYSKQLIWTFGEKSNHPGEPCSCLRCRIFPIQCSLAMFYGSIDCMKMHEGITLD